MLGGSQGQYLAQVVLPHDHVKRAFRAKGTSHLSPAPVQISTVLISPGHRGLVRSPVYTRILSSVLWALRAMGIVESTKIGFVIILGPGRCLVGDARSRLTNRKWLVGVASINVSIKITGRLRNGVCGCLHGTRFARATPCSLFTDLSFC